MARKKAAAKPPRRKPGTGSIRHKPGRAQPFEAAFPIEPGRYRYDYFTSAAEAAAHLDRLTAERDSTTAPRDIAKGSQTVQVFLSAWLVIKEGLVSAKTFQDYRYQCRLVIAEIGSYRLDEVKLITIDTMLATFARKGYRNVAQMRMVLRQAFDYAAENDYILKNPVQKSTAPRTKHRKAIALTEAQRTILLDAATVEAGLALLPLWHLCSRLALRRGEALGLMWTDIDFDGATITIQRQRTTVGNATITKDATKTSDSRTVPIPADLVELLRQHRLAQRRREIADLDWIDTGLVFVGDHGKPPAANRVNRRLAKLVERVNAAGDLQIPADLRPHDLRHTALTILALNGTPAAVRKRLSGHSTAKMDELYTSHAEIEDVRRALG